MADDKLEAPTHPLHVQMTPPSQWQQSPTTGGRKPVPVSPGRTPPPPTASPHRRSPSSTPGTTSSQSFAERAAAAYFPAPTSGVSTPRPKPSPVQVESFEYTNYSPASTYASTPRYAGPPDSKHLRTDSRSALLSPAMAPPWGHMPPQGPPYGYNASHPGLYQKYWHPSWNMYLFLVVGIMFAMGHHFFYASLDGRDADNQLRMLRYGATMSFLGKASLAAAVILAFRQRVWMTVRRKVLSLAAVDALFAAAEDMSAVFNMEVFKQARVAMVLAVYVWCTPLVVILTSETLAVELTTRTEKTTCPSIRTLNFTHEETNDWRVGQKIQNLWELSVCYWNTTSLDTTDPNWFDYYTGTSQQFEEVAILGALLKRPITRTGAGEEICGVGWNCSYSITFTGPGYKCTELASGVGSKPKDLGGAKVPFGTEILAPTGNYTYFSQAFRGEYADIQIDAGDAGVPNMKPPFPKNFGALRTEPIIWLGYAAVDDPSQPQPGNSSDPMWASAFTPKIFGCEHWETAYEVDFSYTGQVQKAKVTKRTYLNPIIDTVYEPDKISNDVTLDNTTATPEKNYIFPTDLRRYRRTAAYHSIGSRLRTFVNGTIEEPGNIVKTHAIQTRLIDRHSWLGVRNLMEEVQSFHEDILLSMFSNPSFLAVVWAAAPSNVTGTLRGGDETKYPCVRERTDNRYRYHASDLWIVYSIAIILACTGVAFGVLAVKEEGLVRNTRFSSIVAATRGPGLEKLPWGLDGPARGDVRRTKVGYGLVPRGLGVDPANSSYGFGVAGDVRQEDGGQGQARWTGSPFRRWERLNG